MEDKQNNRTIVQKANILYHSKLAETYDQTQPQFSPENVIQVRSRIENFAKITNGKRLLDVGCGTGFISSLSHSIFEEVHGVDITPAMLEIASSKFKKQCVKNVTLKQASSDDLPFTNQYFNVAVAYGFLHHLPSLFSTFNEVYRVLKSGGIFYSDLDPNYYFWESMNSLPEDGKNISELLEIERKSVCNMAEEVQNVVGKSLDDETIEIAEYLKTQGGFKEDCIKDLLIEVGFKDIQYEYTWYWQQGKVIKDLSLDIANYFENHLRSALPVTRGFFKYVRIVAIK
jgi:ubiquinone/menaquinone biosynthesis C-methylase UbiE